MQNRHQKPLHPLSHQHQKHEVEVCREKRNVTGRSHSQKLNRKPCSDFLKVLALNYLLTIGIFPHVSFVSPKRAVNSAQSGRFRAEPPESSPILRKGTKVLGPIRQVRFTRTALRQANIRENKGASPNKIQVKHPHQRRPYAVKFEDRSQETSRIGPTKRLKDRSDAPAETRGNLPRISTSSKKRKKLHSIHLLRSGLCRPHPQ